MKKVISFDIGGTNMRVAIINENYEIEKILIESTIKNSLDNFLNQAVGLVKKLNLNEEEFKNIYSISCGVPGRVKWDGSIYELPNIGLSNVNLAEALNTQYHINCFVKNDAEMAGLGEAFLGAGKGYRSVCFITISTGIGVSFIRDNVTQVIDDEMGHSLIEYNNELFEFEKLFSGNGLINLSKINYLSIDHAYELFLKKEEGDQKAIKVYNIWLKAVSSLIKFISVTYEMDIFVLSGGVMKSSQYFLDDLIEECKGIEIKLAKNLQNAGLFGSAYFGFNPSF